MLCFKNSVMISHHSVRKHLWTKQLLSLLWSVESLLFDSRTLWFVVWAVLLKAAILMWLCFWVYQQRVISSLSCLISPRTWWCQRWHLSFEPSQCITLTVSAAIWGQVCFSPVHEAPVWAVIAVWAIMALTAGTAGCPAAGHEPAFNLHAVCSYRVTLNSSVQIQLLTAVCVCVCACVRACLFFLIA